VAGISLPKDVRSRGRPTRVCVTSATQAAGEGTLGPGNDFQAAAALVDPFSMGRARALGIVVVRLHLGNGYICTAANARPGEGETGWCSISATRQHEAIEGLLPPEAPREQLLAPDLRWYRAPCRGSTERRTLLLRWR